MKYFSLAVLSAATLLASSCQQKSMSKEKEIPQRPVYKLYDDPNRFADIQMIRYEVPGFENLSLNQKILVYYLSEAALCGRDIIYDQNNKHNLRLRKALEELYTHYKGDKKSDEFRYFEVYLKRFWASNGLHHMYAETKLVPEFSSGFLNQLISQSEGANLPVLDNDTAEFKKWMHELLFNPSTESKRVNKANGIDLVKESANNFYEGVTKSEVDEFYNDLKKKDTSLHPVSYGLNSKLIKENGQITEKVWKVGGMYGNSISKMVEWLEKAITVAETPRQAEVLKTLVDFYRTGDLKKWDEYNIKWVQDVNNSIDVINGFIENYRDAVGKRASFESAVEINDAEASKRLEVLSANAQYFENNSPTAAEFKKDKVVGISYKLVNVVMEGGDLAPLTAIGINLPNTEWIKETYGSKSVSLGNITEAYNKLNSGSLLDEFCWDTVQSNRSKLYGSLASKMHTALHEVIGHASGKLNPGITKANLDNYGSALEEGRADLVALYFIMDQKLVDLKLIPSLEVGKAGYDEYIRNGLMVQLRRLEPGASIEEDHMRNRQMIAAWAYERGKAENVIEKKIKNGKTYFVINDYDKLRVIFGELLNKVQSIVSRGALAEGKELIENYGVKVDQNLHTEILKRSKALDIAPYKCFIQPKLVPVIQNGQITDVKIEYQESFVEQMLRYSKDYSFLPMKN